MVCYFLLLEKAPESHPVEAAQHKKNKLVNLAQMSLSHEHVGSKIPAKINIYMLTRAELLIHLCYEIPCKTIKYVTFD